MELYLHSPHVFTAWCLIKQEIRFHYVVLSEAQGHLTAEIKNGVAAET